MLVQIQGNIIDTEKIWTIYPIYNDLYPVPYFQIESFEKGILKIYGDSAYSRADIKNIVGQQAKYDAASKILEIARQELINYWNKSKSTIPEIKIE